jgi:hypothetical protein
MDFETAVLVRWVVQLFIYVCFVLQSDHCLIAKQRVIWMTFVG